VSRQFRVEHPLINQAFQTDGLDLFVERYGELINASREGQHGMKEIIGVYLKRIEWDSKGIPIRLYPFTRDTQAEAAPLVGPSRGRHESGNLLRSTCDRGHGNPSHRRAASPMISRFRHTAS